MKVALATDHAAFKLKVEVNEYLIKKGHEVIDFGAYSEETVDYPDTIGAAARAVGKGDAERGVVLCGSGIGASIVANKIKGVRAVLCLDEYSAEYSRKHNNTNVIALAGRRRTFDEISRYLDIWFETPFEGGRHQNRIDKISLMEE